MPILSFLFLLGVLMLSGSAAAERPLNFETDIEPIFSRHGCNSSGCHGKAEGQNGFKLSVFGFDPETDYRALLMEGRGRRVFPAAPEHSLLLLKASGGLPHGGGVRIRPNAPEYATLRRWIAEGARFGQPTDPNVVGLELSPSRGRLTQREEQPLQATAIWSDGRREDVTHLALFQTNNSNLATVDQNGFVHALDASGAVAIMASFAGHVDVFEAIIPRSLPLKTSPSQWPVANAIDTLIYQRLTELRIEPSGRCDDAAFMRRVYLDLIGTLPTPGEVRRWLADNGEDRRGRLVDELLIRPEYASFWAQYWADLLRVNRQTLGRERAHRYYRWLHRQLADDRPWDALARDIVTAEGPLVENPAALFYRSVGKPDEMAATVSQVFLGVRIQCAQCHHHPWDRWGQSDYFGMQAVFAEVGFKTNALGDVLRNKRPGPTKHPRTGQPVEPKALGGAELSSGQRRRQLAHWMTSDNNPWFAENLANRIWARMMGRGLVEPVDDFRSTNPPSHPLLLAHLARELRDNDFDAKHLIRHIAASEAYQRSHRTNPSNQKDGFNYSRYPMKTLPAEVVFDAVCQVTGVDEKFAGLPAGIRAIELWDSHVPHYFLRLFGRPVRETACECERVSEPNVSQVLHLLNSPKIHQKIAHGRGRVRELVHSTADDGRIVDELYLAALSRFPTAAERAAVLRHVQQESRQAAADPATDPRQRAFEDLTWSLLNTLEFLLNH